MKKDLYHLRNQKDTFLIEVPAPVITWLDWIGSDAIATPDLVILIEAYYYES